MSLSQCECCNSSVWLVTCLCREGAGVAANFSAAVALTAMATGRFFFHPQLTSR